MFNNLKSFEEFCISESFNIKPVNWDLVKNNDIENIYRFIIDNNTYLVFFKIPIRDNKPTIVDFGIHDANTNNIVYTMTKTGNVYTVLMTVIDTIKDFISRNDPYGIEFSARKDINDKDSKSRATVYTRLVKKFMPSHYNLTMRDTGHEIHYTLIKNPKT